MYDNKENLGKTIPFAPKGTRIKWKGDLVCIVNRDCFSGDPMTIEDFTWHSEKPMIGDPIHPALIMWFAFREKQIRDRGLKIVDNH